MLKWLTGKHPIPVWVIKQIDADLLHLCGQGHVVSQARSSRTLQQLQAGRYEGAVTMASGGLVLNARLFAALVPLDALQLDARGHAQWDGRLWHVAQVPQRCWTFEGRLVPQRQMLGDQEQWVSVEDVSDIRRQAQASAEPARVVFDPYGINEHPLIARRNERSTDASPHYSPRSDKGRGHDD